MAPRDSLYLLPHINTSVFLSSSAFFVFCSDHRPKIKEENPGMSIGDIAKKLGELWATQTPKDKAPYTARAAKLKERYEKVHARLKRVTGIHGDGIGHQMSLL